MNILENVNQEGLIFDGAMGSMLIQAGLKGGKASEFWNIEKPEVIESIHRAYFEAGADVATVNTFGGSAFKMAKMGITHSPEQINTAAVHIAKKAAGEGQYVAGGMGPLGEMLKPAGLVSVEDAVSCFAQQAGFLAGAGVDCFILETFFDLNEILAAIRGLRQASSLPIFASMTFQKKQNGFFTIMGNKPVESMNVLLEAGASVVGANCSLTSDTMIELAQEIRHNIDAPIIIQPNAGAPKAVGESIIYPESVEHFSDNMKKLKELGVNVVGGCCGSTPDFIRSTAEKIKKQKV